MLALKMKKKNKTKWQESINKYNCMTKLLWRHYIQRYFCLVPVHFRGPHSHTTILAKKAFAFHNNQTWTCQRRVGKNLHIYFAQMCNFGFGSLFRLMLPCFVPYIFINPKLCVLTRRQKKRERHLHKKYIKSFQWVAVLSITATYTQIRMMYAR